MAALDIFLHCIFMVYLKYVDRKFGITKNSHIFVAICLVPLVGSVFSAIDRPLIYMCNICMDSAWCQQCKYVNLKCMIYWRRYCSLKTTTFFPNFSKCPTFGSFCTMFVTSYILKNKVDIYMQGHFTIILVHLESFWYINKVYRPI